MKNTKTQAIRFHQPGGPAVLQFEEIDLSEPQDDEVQIDHKYIGVNFVDTYYRSGLYPSALPSGIGNEASGIVEKVGKSVTHLKVGDRVAYCLGPLGAYSCKRNLQADKVIVIPDNVSFEAAASLMLKALTVSYLFKDVYPLKSGETILFHAAAGGVGLIACQWAKHLGVKLVGTASSEEKGSVAKKLGAYEIINYKKEDIVKRLLEITGGEKVPVVYDSVGQSTWEKSLDSLQPCGLMVSFGNTTGAVTGVNLGILAQKGGLFVTRPMLAHYMDTSEKLQKAAKHLFDLVAAGIIVPQIDSIYKLEEAQMAHEALLDSRRLGTVLLKV